MTVLVKQKNESSLEKETDNQDKPKKQTAQEKKIKKLHEQSLSFSYFAHIFSYPSSTILHFFSSSPPNIADIEADYTKLLFCQQEEGKMLSSPLHETSYTKAGSLSKPQEMADIAGFYKAFGLQVKTGDDRPDHIAMELEFMAFLILKEERALKEDNKEGAQICRKAQKLFIKDHLGYWISAFITRLPKILNEDSFYCKQAQALSKLIQSELKRLAVKLPENPPDIIVEDHAVPDDNPTDGCPGIPEGPIGQDIRNIDSKFAICNNGNNNATAKEE